MNIADAAYHTVHDYPGGAGALVKRMAPRQNQRGELVEMSEAVLNSKVNPNTRTHIYGLLEASEIMGLTGDFRVLHSLAAEHGFGLVLLEPGEAGGLMDSFLAASGAKGALAMLLSEVLADHKVSPNEADQVDQLCLKAQAFLVQLSARARAAAQAGAH
ncbi:phage regulatory CII family protein [Xanthomonas sp. NCPPB 1062]|uniref:phage regulatory CII family protein n=1 Tax=Xanthomonas sp. NCPPB 1062 TaxID=487523 RepID=UPI003558EBAF